MLFMHRVPRLITALQLFPVIRAPLQADLPACSLRLRAANSVPSPNIASPPLTPCTGNSSIRQFHQFPSAMASSAGAGPAPAPADLKGSLSEIDDSFVAQTCPAPAPSSSSSAAEPEAKNNGQPAPESKEAAAEPAPKLPPLSPADFRAFNRLSEHMNMFHNHFRQTWTMIYQSCTANKRPAGMSLKRFIDEGLQFIAHLTGHHNFEEAYIFPVLAKKMPEFKSGKGNGAAELLRQHRQIHKGMDQFEEYLKACRSGERELEMSVLKEKMDNWGTVLWTHLDQEVKTLAAENMRRYWTIDEMRRLPI